MMGVASACPDLSAPDPNRRLIAGIRNLEHSFDEHAAQWFGRQVFKSRDMSEWQAIIEKAAGSKLRFNWDSEGTPTIAYLARIGNRYFVVQFFAEGEHAGELATAFAPNNGQLGAMLRALGIRP